MKILVFGAGVTGSLLASRLAEGGCDVTVLARGKRLRDIREHGIVIDAFLQKKRTEVRVPVIESLDPSVSWDLVVIVPRKNQVPEILDELKAGTKGCPVLFLGNTATGGKECVEALGADRVLLGFPASGGRREDYVIRAVYREKMPITVGELSGETTPRLESIRREFGKAGVGVTVSARIDAWLKCHLALVLPLAAGVYLHSGDMHALSMDRDTLLLILKAVREGFAALGSLSYPPEPGAFRLLLRLPDFLFVRRLAKTFDSEAGELAIRDHAMAARDEMTALADEFLTLIKDAKTGTFAIERLFASFPGLATFRG